MNPIIAINAVDGRPVATLLIDGVAVAGMTTTTDGEPVLLDLRGDQSAAWGWAQQLPPLHTQN